MKTARILLNLLRLLFVVQLILGIIIWTGHGTALVSIHIIVGFLFVVTLWAIALAALIGRRMIGLAIGAIVWGVIIVGFGFAQLGILPGSLHWIIRVVHLLIAAAAMPMAERLAGDR